MGFWRWFVLTARGWSTLSIFIRLSVSLLIGLAAGIGFVDGALYALILVIFIFKVFNRIDLYVREHANEFNFYIEFSQGTGVAMFMDEMQKRNVKIVSMELDKSRFKGNGPSAIITLEIHDRHRKTTILSEIQSMDFIRFAEET